MTSSPASPIPDDADVSSGAETENDLATLLARREHARPNRATWGLLAALVLAVGFVGGAFAGNSFGSARTGPSDVPGAASGFDAEPLGDDVTTLGSGEGTPDATGTIVAVDANTITLTDAEGQGITVTVPTTASVTVSAEGSLADLAVGDVIAVDGKVVDDGTITATRVTEQAPADQLTDPARP